MSSGVARSQIQKQVLSLYKECLRAAEMKNRQFKSVVRSDFKRNAKAIQRSDTMRIEYLVRQGQRRLKMMKVSVYVYAFKVSYEPFFERSSLIAWILIKL